ncbi:hypothetical protein BD769DRAFT_1668897 [Suillus cothurnatus]|nr:hypothetical protein BD769DRAFT_1668897 [Suillus cothurnatus]
MYHKSLFPDLPKVPESNVHHLIFNRPDQQEWPDYTLFVNIATGQRRSFREFVERVLRPENGDTVGILSENCPDFVALVHSLLAITVPFALFSSYSTPYEFKHANSLAQATRIFASPSLLQLALTSGLPADRIYLLEGESKDYISYDQLISSARKNGIPRLPVRHATKDTLAYLIYSSGTSGPPKAIMASHGNITTSVLSTMVYGMETAKSQPPPVWNTPEGLQVTFSVLPLYHSTGFCTTSFFNFFNPSTTVMLPKWDIDIFFDNIPKYHITTMILVPSLVHQLVHHPRFKTTDMKSVKAVGSGGAYLPPQLADQICARFPDMPRVAEGYGMSEFTIAIAMKPIPGILDGRAKNKPGSAGILVPVSKPALSVPTGLLRAQTSRASFSETFVDGWVRTGDQIRIDEDGDTLKISGMQVSPVEIENTMLEQPDKLITDVSIAGVSGGRTSDERIPRAWIVLSPAGAALGEKEVVTRLDAWVKERLSRYKWLRGGIGIVEAIPKLPTGKVLRRVLVEEYEKEVKAKAKL